MGPGGVVLRAPRREGGREGPRLYQGAAEGHDAVGDSAGVTRRPRWTSRWPWRRGQKELGWSAREEMGSRSGVALGREILLSSDAGTSGVPIVCPMETLE